MNTNNILPSLGFTMNPSGANCVDFGRIEAEPYNVGKDHFQPFFRHVFIGKCKGGYYVTSHINGNMRKYRCRIQYEAKIGNIFGGGKTRRQAIERFAENFRNKSYNFSK